VSYKAIVVGASTGIGRELVKQLAAQGSSVAAIARRSDKLEELKLENPTRIHTYSHDVTCGEEVPALFSEIVKDLGGLDVIVYCAGVMPEVGPAEFNFDKDKQMIEVNVTGAIAWLNEAANRFAHTGTGSIVGIGSVAGDRGRSGQPVYNMTKAALATYLEALRNRLHKLGVCVVTIKPGPTATPMTAHLKSQSMMSAEAVAAFVISKIKSPGEHYVKFSHRVIFWVIRNFPSPLFRRLSI
jgi:short-subunit dehydrogenase